MCGRASAARARRRSRRNPLIEPRRGDVVAFLLAHPDDESLFTGGTLARLAEANAAAVLITATMGELGRPNDPLVRASLGDDVTIATVRKAELSRACRALGVAHHVFLGAEGRFTDSGYETRVAGSRCLANSLDAAAAELFALLRIVSPHVLVTFDRDGCTGHPDHLACHEIGIRAAAALSAQDDRLAGVALVADPLPRHRRRARAETGSIGVDVSSARKRKAIAVGCHFSQVGHAVDDRTRLRYFDQGSAVARYVPHVLSNRVPSWHECYAWIPATQLRPIDVA